MNENAKSLSLENQVMSLTLRVTNIEATLEKIFSEINEVVFNLGVSVGAISKILIDNKVTTEKSLEEEAKKIVDEMIKNNQLQVKSEPKTDKITTERTNPNV